MALFSVSPLKEDELLARMARLGLREEDLEETFVRSSVPGGQHVNKTATAVALTHRPSGVSVRCQKTRSQAMNRFYPPPLPLPKLEPRRRPNERARRQRRPPPRRARAKMLEDKHRQAGKKALRGPVRPGETN